MQWYARSNNGFSSIKSILGGIEYCLSVICYQHSHICKNHSERDAVRGPGMISWKISAYNTHTRYIKISRVFTICGDDVAPFISIIFAEEFRTRVGCCCTALLICQLNVTENFRGDVHLAPVLFFLLSSARDVGRKYCFNIIPRASNLCSARFPTIVAAPRVVYYIT